MTGQSLLDRMELLNRELQLQTGEDDVVRGLIALNVAQDQFETLLATFPRAKATTGTVTTTANQEYTTYPSGLLRLDRLQFIDSATSLPAWDLDHFTEPGQVATGRSFPWQLQITATTGKPAAYWEDGEKIWWNPIPDATHTIRWTGLSSASDITASGTFAYPDAIALPLASVAVQLIKVGLDDDGSVLEALTQQFLVPAVRQMDRHNRDGATPLRYSRSHDA